MGLLKHAILPFFLVLHVYVAYLILIRPNGKREAIDLFGWPPKPGKKLQDQSFTIWEEHALAMLGGVQVMLGIGCLLGILQEKSHFRGILIVLELVYLVVGTYDAHQRNFPTSLPVVFIGLAVLGLVVHALEPGIFTQDNNTPKSKTKSR